MGAANSTAGSALCLLLMREGRFKILAASQHGELLQTLSTCNDAVLVLIVWSMRRGSGNNTTNGSINLKAAERP